MKIMCYISKSDTGSHPLTGVVAPASWVRDDPEGRQHIADDDGVWVRARIYDCTRASQINPYWKDGSHIWLRVLKDGEIPHYPAVVHLPSVLSIWGLRIEEAEVTEPDLEETKIYDAGIRIKVMKTAMLGTLKPGSTVVYVVWGVNSDGEIGSAISVYESWQSVMKGFPKMKEVTNG